MGRVDKTNNAVDRMSADPGADAVSVYCVPRLTAILRTRVHKLNTRKKCQRESGRRADRIQRYRKQAASEDFEILKSLLDIGYSSLILRSLVIMLLIVQPACRREARSVVVYVSVDQVYSEPILKRFETESGIRVRAVYDVEAAKTTGLVTRLIAEKQNPRADLFWNGEFAQTIRLKEEGILASARPATASGLSPGFADPGGFWFGLGARVRVLLVNRNLLPPNRYPKSLHDFLNPEYPAERIGMALPLFGTSATQAAALAVRWGDLQAMDWYRQVRSRGVRIVDGNAAVRDMVAGGRWFFGLTDSDDALSAIKQGTPVEVVAPDQDESGTLLIPGTAAVIRGGPNPAAAEELLDFLLRQTTQESLVESGFCQWDLTSVHRVSPMFPAGLKTMEIDLNAVHRKLPGTMLGIKEIFAR
jgi:iron(III) transport system substrate-binding protein